MTCFVEPRCAVNYSYGFAKNLNLSMCVDQYCLGT